MSSLRAENMRGLLPESIGHLCLSKPSKSIMYGLINFIDV